MKGASVPETKPLPQFVIRMPRDLKAWLTAKAVENKRSLNSELVYRLQESSKQEQAHASKT